MDADCRIEMGESITYDQTSFLSLVPLAKNLKKIKFSVEARCCIQSFVAVLLLDVAWLFL